MKRIQLQFRAGYANQKYINRKATFSGSFSVNNLENQFSESGV